MQPIIDEMKWCICKQSHLFARVAKCVNKEIATCVIKDMEFSVGCITGFIHSLKKNLPLNEDIIWMNRLLFILIRLE